MLQPHKRKAGRFFTESGSEVLLVGEVWETKRTIRHQFHDLEVKGLVTVRRSSNETPLYVELNFIKDVETLRRSGTGDLMRWTTPTPRVRSWMVENRIGKRFIDAQAWAIQEVRKEIKKRFRESNK